MLYRDALRDILSFVLANFLHQGLQEFFENGTKRGIQPQMARRIEIRLDVMNLATELAEINAYPWNLHPLKGNREGTWSLSVNAQWRITFRFENGDCLDVNLEQYH